MRDLCYTNRVRIDQSAQYTPQENGKKERAWGTLMGMTRCLLATAGLSKEFWTSALHDATFIKNRTIQSSIGCTSYKKNDIHFENQFRKKVIERAKVCLLLGYDRRIKTVIYGDYSSGRFRTMKSRNVNFDERNMYTSSKAQDEDKEKGQVL